MKNLITTSLIFILSFSLMGCNTMNNQEGGALVGGVAGGLLGSTIGHGGGQMFAIVAGTLAGALIGGSIGQSMDRTDRLRMTQALNNNAIGEPAYWRNEERHAHYEVVPVKNVTVGSNRYCREYKTVADIAGKQQQMYGTACRQPDGTWQAVT